LERELGDVSVTAKTFQVKDPWPVLMIVQIRMENKHCAWFQNFMRVEDAKKALDDWDDHFHWIGG
jgi:hypothetical protein